MQAIYEAHNLRYPLSEAQDYLKLAYQSEFGGGHLTLDPVVALDRLNRELAELSPRSVPLPIEPIGGGLARLHLQAMSGLHLRPETVTGLFLDTCHPRGNTEGLVQRLRPLEFLFPRYQDILRAYLAESHPPVRHSAAYRAAYAPAYRLVCDRLTKYLPIFQEIDRLLEAGRPVRIAIDGPCASGKTTLGCWLRRVYAGALISMDDFFLPQARKTAQRLQTPGGNVDHERFAEEILRHPRGAALTYRPFNCAVQETGSPVFLPAHQLLIVEGSYSQHPTLRDAYDLCVFLDISRETQRQRILSRNPPSLQTRFFNEWIPLENAYFDACHPKQHAELTFETP